MGIIETAAEDVAKTAVGGAAGSSMLPWLILGALAVVAGAAVGGYVYGHHVEEVQFDLYKTAQQAAAEKQVAANKTALLAQQQADQAEMSRINQSHGVQLNEITQRRDALLAANRSLSQRLYVGVAGTGWQPAQLPETGASGPVDAGDTQAALSVGSSEFFIREFAQADADLATIGALQQVVVHDREVCNGQLPGVTQAPAVQ